MKSSDWYKKFKIPQKRYVYLVISMLLGITLMLFPNSSEQNTQKETNEIESTLYSVQNEEKRLEGILSEINGVGECRVLLSVHTDAERILAEDDGETVVLSEGSKQQTVTIQTKYPSFQGAIIVSGGCDDPSVRYDILSSVMAYTGLGADRITICPIKTNLEVMK